MTEPEPNPRLTRIAERILSLLPAVFLATIAVAGLMVFISIRAATTDDAVQAARRDHATSVCILKLFHDLSQASGTSPEERAAAFERSFTAEKLRANCQLTDEEIALVTSR